MSSQFSVDLPFGAQVQPDGDVRFRLWAPGAKTVSVELVGHGIVTMQPEIDSDGWFSTTTRCAPGTPYRYLLMSQIDGEVTVPDPASRSQAGDVHDPSVVVDPHAYTWQFPNWAGRPWHETVLYEIHPGASGGFAGIQQRLPELASLGITAIELMPVADFPGAHNWGYDGVLPFAVDASYGTPEQLKALVDTAHGLGMMVFLDVVYNHFGPDGNYLHTYAPAFFREDVKTLWGPAIDFRRPEVSDFFIQNALYWLQEYRFDGLRFDAAHAIGEQAWLSKMAREIRKEIGHARHVHLVLEHDGNAAHLLGFGADAASYAAIDEHAADHLYDAQWNDDGHHVLHVLLTGEDSGYYAAYADQPAERLARCLKEGFVYQGETPPGHDNKPRGEPSGELPPTSFVLFLQNHDQIGNRALGERLAVLAHPLALRAAQALVLLSPQIPMLFMGEEFGAIQPFYYFTSHTDAQLAEAVREGRKKEFSRFPAFSDPHTLGKLPDPNAFSTFIASIPEPGPAPASSVYLQQIAMLLQIRALHIAPHLRGAHAIEAKAIGPKAVNARWMLGNRSVLNITINLAEQPLTESLDQLSQPAGADVLFDSGSALSGLAEGSFPGYSILVLSEPPAPMGAF